jgi:hypothetical protein
MVIVRLPVLAVRLTVTVIVDVPDPGAAIELGLKDTVTPLPSPDADKLIAELNPPETAVAIVDVPEPRRSIVSELGDALIVKLGFVPVTVRLTVVVSVVLPEAPFTVMLYVPATLVEATVKVSVELPAPVIEAGLNATVTPVGAPLADNVIVESNPPLTVLLIVVLPVPPCATLSDDGDAERMKLGVDDVPPASAVSSPDPFGLPQPVARS